MKYSSSSILAVAAIVASANANVVSVTQNSTVFSSTASVNSTTPTATVYASTAIAANGTGIAYTTGTAYPSSCIVLVSGTGLPIVSSTAQINATGSTYYPSSIPGVVTVTASAAGTKFTTAPVYSSSSGRLVNYTITASSYAQVNFTTSFAVPTSRAVYNATVTSIYATVYTTAPGAVTTVFPSSYAVPTASAIPICGGNGSYEFPGGSTVAQNATATAALTNGTNTNNSTAQNDLSKNGAGAAKGSFGAVFFAAGLAIAAL
ncbi:hypothetical protein BDN70DRAFT_886616 [Pholiota conissans]|uniref:Uncharacterized protein n=1 Tax=Pholiota conissans TaxID=109636 RepID=A0A9P6CMV7_9AGAR|nr:hypothetical protein BDN70DRAFT_886616 [Pholiota conissans]